MRRIQRPVIARWVRAFSHAQGSLPPPPPKQLTQILRDMQARLPKALRTNVLKDVKRSAAVRSTSYTELRASLSPGDLILTRSSPAVVLELRGAPSWKYVISDSKGQVEEIGAGAIDARLGQLLTPSEIRSTDMLRKADSKRESKILSPELYAKIAPPLKQLYNDALRHSTRLLPFVRNVFEQYQDELRGITFAFHDLLGLVEMLAAGDSAASQRSSTVPLDNTKPHHYLLQPSPSQLYGLRMALKHYSVAEKVNVDFSYLGNYSVTLLSRKLEKEHNFFLNTSTATGSLSARLPLSYAAYLHDYSIGNISSESHQAEGIALEILRNYHTTRERENDEHTAGLVANEYGLLDPDAPALSRQSYDSFLRPLVGLERKLNNALKASADTDTLGDLRKEFSAPVYCIDGARSAEIDDGISIRVDGDVVQVAVHIVNPTSAFSNKTSLIEKVYSRSSSVYLPTGHVPMLPDTLTSAFGFIAKKSRRALSVIGSFNVKTGEATRIEVLPVNVSNIVQLTYEDVEKNLASDKPNSELVAASRIARLLNRQRRERFAGFAMSWSSSPQVHVTGNAIELASGTETATLRATELVTEFMIWANSQTGRLMKEAQIPGLFRRQQLQFADEAQRQDFQRLVASGASIGVEWQNVFQRAYFAGPGSHESVGSDPYGSFTSPLRRGPDIINHIQLEAMLRGERPLLSAGTISRMLPWLNTSQGLMRECQKAATRYWILKHMSKCQITKLQGVFIRYKDDRQEVGTVHLPEWGINADLIVSPRTRNLAAGDRREFLVLELAAEGDLLRVKENE